MRRLIFFVLMILLHGSLLAFDAGHPDAMTHGDRAGPRLRSAVELSSGQVDDLSGFLIERGLLGDYMGHFVLYHLFGRLGLIVAQIILAFVSFLFLYKLMRLFTDQLWMAELAVVVYALLPHTITFPHLVMSEALFNPLVLVGTYFILRAHLEPDAGWKPVVFGAALLGIASLVRMIGVVVILCLIVPMVARRGYWRQKAVATLVYTAIALLPLLSWMSFVQTQTGHFSLGDSAFSLGFNLTCRVERMERHSGSSLLDPERVEFETGVGDYLGFIARNSEVYARVVRSDFLNYVANPGITKLLVNYLELGSAHRGADRSMLGWRTVMDRSGPVAAITHVFREAPVFSLLLFGAVGFWIVFCMIGIVGAIQIWKQRLLPLCLRLVIPGIVFALFAISTNTIATVRSGHRSPTEFLMVVLFVFGLKAVWQFVVGVRSRRQQPRVA